MIRNIFIILIVLQTLFAFEGTAQTVSGPRSETTSSLRSLDELPGLILPEFDVEARKREDALNRTDPRKPLRFGKSFDVNLELKKEGLSESLPGKGTIWRFKVKSEGALSLNLMFGRYRIPPGADVFIYNTGRTHVLERLTDAQNKLNGIVPVMPVRGNEILIEYFEPENALFAGDLVITKIGHDYMGFYDGQFGMSQSCNLDINCSQGSGWQNEKESVCRILIQLVSLCSGALIGNVDHDGTPYVLTAEHCIETSSDASSAIFVFNYESPSCGGPDGSVSQTVTGSTLRANWDTSDFSLVELSSSPPSSYNAYWSGWNRSSSTPSAPVVSIHHPAGDVKKFSRDNSAPSTFSTHFWEVIDWTVGTVEPGSSGGPFYNANRQIVGQVSSGNFIFCTTTEQSVYGKFSSSWNGGGSSSSRLRDWLDPANTITSIAGLRWISSATINSSSSVSGEIVKFQNVSVSGGSNISVEFEDLFEASGTFNAPVGTVLSIQP